jgi:hypothetical protein
LIQQCESHMCSKDFNVLVASRDKYLEDIEDYITKQNDAAELSYGNASPAKGQSRLHKNINNILAGIK